MVNPVRTQDRRFQPLSQRDPSYTLTYSQPRLTGGKPPNLVWEAKEEHFTAPDDTTAHRKMCEFIGQGHLIFKGESCSRELTLFKRDHPSRVLRESNVGRVLHTAES